MFHWLRLLRSHSSTPRTRRGRHSITAAQPILVQLLESREMLTRLESTPITGIGSDWDYNFQDANELYHQYYDSLGEHLESLGAHGDPGHSDPASVDFNISGVNPETQQVGPFESSLRITPTTQSIEAFTEHWGDPAYLYVWAGGGASGIYGEQGIFSYNSTVGSRTLNISNATLPDENGSRFGSMLLKVHVGDSFDYKAELSGHFNEDPVGDIGGGNLIHSFTANSIASGMHWELGSNGETFLSANFKNYVSGFSPDIDFPYDPYSGPDSLFVGMKVRLVWSSTANPSGALGTAYNYVLTEQDTIDPFPTIYVGVSQFAEAPAGTKYLVMVLDPDNTLWESHEDDNYDAIAPIANISEVKANYDENIAPDFFGTYLAGVPLDTTFTVKTLDPSQLGKSVRYTITKPNGDKVKEGTAAAISTPGQYQDKFDVGKLPGGTLDVKFELLNGAGQPLPNGDFNGQIIVKDQLDLDFKGAADGNPVAPLDKLRFIEEIGVITDFEASLNKLPLYDQYKDKFDFVIRDASSKAEVLRKPIMFEKLPQITRAEVQDWNSGDKLHALQDAVEYEAVLSAREKTTTTFDSAPLNVVKLPKWLSGKIVGNPSSYDYVDNHFVIHASYPPQTSNIPLPAPNDSYGLFTGATSQISAGIEFDVFAGLSTSDPVTANMQQLVVVVKLLGQDLVPKTTYSLSQVAPIPLENKTKLIDAGPVKIDTGEIPFAKNIKLFDASVGKSKDFSLTQAILSKLGGPATGLIDLDVSVKGTLDKFFGRGKFTITGTSGDNPQFDAKTSYFTVTAEATGEVAANATASLSLPGVTLVSSSIGGKVWVKVVGDAALNFSGAVLTPSISYAEDHTRLAAQFGANLTVSGQILDHPPVVNELFKTESKVYTLFGSESVTISLKDPETFEKIGDGIVTTSNVARPAVADVALNPTAAMAAPTVSTLTFKDALDSATSRIQLDYDITSTIKPLAAGRHRVEIVAVPNDTAFAETVLGTVDLATLPLSTDPQGGFRSASQLLTLNLIPGQLKSQLNQHLVLRLISDPASGEIVRLRPSNIDVTVAEPTLSLTAPTGVLADGAIVFGTETGGATKVDLQLANVGGPMLLVDNLRVEGSNLRLSSTGRLDLYGNDLTTPLAVEVINPALAASGVLRFATNDPTRPEVSIPVSYQPPNTAPTIGGLPANQSVNDTTTIVPFAAIAVTDPNNQNMLAKVTITNGVVRGDFTVATTAGWTRTITGNNIVYSRFYNPAPNIGSVVQAALRAFVFQPRANAIKPNTTELADITVFVNDGIANTTATTRITTTSVNNTPQFGGLSVNVPVTDKVTVNPLAALIVNDADTQEMLISVTILNGKVRGDFTTASTAGWAVRYTTGNDITYKRYFGPQANVGAAAQAAFRALVFQPRTNAIKPGTTELTDFQVTVSDGVAPAVLGTGTRVTTTSVNDAPTVSGAVANQTMNDNQSKAVFGTLTVTDPDTQDQFVRITINNGTTHGDFTASTTTGWTRKVSGTNILYERFFAAAANNGAVVQTAVRALAFQPRTNVPVGTTETTSFTIFVNDGLANVTNSTTSVITTGVAPRPASSAPVVSPVFLDSDIATIVVPSIKRSPSSLWARLLRKSR